MAHAGCWVAASSGLATGRGPVFAGAHSISICVFILGWICANFVCTPAARRSRAQAPGGDARALQSASTSCVMERGGPTSQGNAINRPILSDLEFVADLGGQWLRRPVPTVPGLVALLAQDALNAEEQATVVQAVGASVADVCAIHGYHSMDLVVLHPATPGLEAAQQRFDQPHTHADDEVRYILEGEGIFGFLDAQGEERVVCVRAGDYLRVPAGVEHRFTLTAVRRIKALRLFADTAGWAAH